ncbi:TPA: RagB/SusD family nutrient uptake outer membrane protein [Elizabethkingia anophelis]|nr:RagB/SusD family nutrient uptake outer membrane protein [Elizabethkingia anophelis]
MKKYFIYTAIITATVTSCNLDTQPMSEIVSDELLSNPNSITTVTNGNYAILKGDADGGGFYNNLYRASEYGTDNVALSGTTTDDFFYMYNYKLVKTGGRVANIWSNGYKAIIGCNKVIELAKEGKDSTTDQLIGENYFLRAYSYFQLVNIFGRPYYQGRENLGVPVKINTDVNNLPPRSTVGQVYDQVISDLLKAETLMSDNTSHIRATKIAAQALLSRVYLYMGDNQKAIEYTNKVISSGERSLLSTNELGDYSKKTPEANNETIFAFKYNKDGDYNHGWYTIGSMFANIQDVGWGEMYASQSYLDLIDQSGGDARRKFISPVYTLDNNGSKIPAVYYVDNNYKYWFGRLYEEGGKTKFKITKPNPADPKTNITYTYELLSEAGGPKGTLYYTYDENNAKTYVTKDYDMDKRNGYPKFYILKCSLQDGIPQLYSPVILRLAEMYLNRAEAYAKQGNVAAALADINIIRQRAGVAAYTSLPTGRNILDVVLDERRLELAFEGHRKFDVFRNGKTLNRRYPGTHLNGASPFYEVKPDDKRVVLYLPESQIIAQPNLIQNPD